MGKKARHRPNNGGNRRDHKTNREGKDPARVSGKVWKDLKSLSFSEER